MNFGDNDKILTQIDVIFTKRKIYIHLQHLGNNNMLFAEKRIKNMQFFRKTDGMICIVFKNVYR